MKGKFTNWLAGVCLLTFMSANAQITGEWLDPTPHGNDYDDVEFVSETVGIAVATGGSIAKSIDGGDTWMATTPITAEDLKDICWIDENNVVVGGNGGTILVSNDAGSTWVKKYMGMSLNIRKIVFVNTTTGYIVANSKHIYKTTDGGETWEASAFENTANLNSIFFADENNGCAVGEASTAAYTTDGGATWMPGFIPPIIVITGPNFNDVYFSDAMNGVLVGATGVILTTNNGGMMWNPVSVTAPDLLSIVPGPAGSLWATTGDANGAVYSTADGVTWDATITNGPFGHVVGRNAADDADSLLVEGLNNGTVLDIAFAGTKMVAVGYGGATSTSSDNGASWTAMNQTDFYHNSWIQAMGYSADKSIVYAGTNGAKNYGVAGNNLNSKMYKSTDGGMTWQHLTAFDWGGGSNSPVTAVLVNPNDANHVIVLGRKRGQWTRDGGETFYNSNDLYVNEDSVLLKGATGLRYDENFAGQWIDDSTIVSIGARNVQMSTDTGANWVIIYDNDADRGTQEDSALHMPNILSNCFWLDRYNGFVNGRTAGLMKTTDGGETWVNISDNFASDPSINLTKNPGNFDIDPSNPMNIAMTWDNRDIVLSRDGGETWEYNAIGGTYGANDVKYVGEGVIWVAGKNPQISLDNGLTWSPRYVNGVNNSMQTDDITVYDESTIIESGAASSKRLGASIIKYTIGAGGLAMPTEQATAVNFTNTGVDTTQFTVNWTRGNGDACAAFIRMYNAGDSVPTLPIFKDYLANPMWGAGQRSNDGWYCIYNGTGTSVDVTGLPIDTMYTVFVAEYKTGNIYNVSNASGNAAHSPEFTVGINKVSAFEGFGVYPNPSNGVVNVAIRAEKAGKGSIRIMNLTGQTVLSRNENINTGLNQYQFDLSEMPSGIYFIEAKKGEKRNVSRLVIN